MSAVLNNSHIHVVILSFLLFYYQSTVKFYTSHSESTDSPVSKDENKNEICNQQLSFKLKEEKEPPSITAVGLLMFDDLQLHRHIFLL